MNIFVTGASGFVGGAATRALVAAGHHVAAMSRSSRTTAVIEALGATPIACDLESIAAEHICGSDVVLHCAAFVEGWGPKDAWYNGNVLGTQRVLDAARRVGAKRFIHIGSEAAIVHGQHIHDTDETYPLAPQSPSDCTLIDAKARADLGYIPVIAVKDGLAAMAVG